MKRILLSAIVIVISLLTIAQDLSRESKSDGPSNTYITVLESRTEVSEDETKSNIYNKVKDYDGNSYSVVKIGNQLWMAENLATTRFSDGTKIPSVSDYKAWSNLLSPGFCWYFNEAENYKASYGALYNGYTVSTGKLCPEGWHVPSAEEWQTLMNFSGGKEVGGKLKETGNEHWMSPNEGATNEVGYSALPGGSRGIRGSFFDDRLQGYWWSSTDLDNNNSLYNSLRYSSNEVKSSSDDKKSGFSVRCIKD
jgi:uncharacterized protein (TIGR02145 family)